MVENHADPASGRGLFRFPHSAKKVMGRYRVRLYLLFFSLLLTLSMVAYLVFSVQRYQGEQMERLEASYEEVKQLDALMLLLLDAETGERGFVITGEEVFLQPYHAAVARVEEARFRFRGESLPGVTVSVGVALYPGQGESPEALINAADRALYQAKKNGRNRVEVSGAVRET